MWVRTSLACAAWLALSLGPVRAEPPAAEPTELRARLNALERSEPLDESVKRPLELAQTALQRASAERARGELVGSERAERLARAAVELAEARLRLLRERALLKAAEARRLAALAERATAEHALERERARVAALEQASAAP